MNSFVERLHNVQAGLDEAVSQLVASDSVMMKMQPKTEQSTLMVAKLAEFSKRPSKRIRGALVVAAYEACGGKNKAVSMELAALIELYHNYLLIVDDVMDESNTRRGGPTVHEQYRGNLAGHTNSSTISHTANMMAVNVGLILQHLLSMHVSELDVEAEVAIQIQKTLHLNLAITGLGQLEDVAHAVSDSLTEKDITDMYAHKSGYYTFVNPLQLGALLARNDELLGSIKAFGVPAGIMFQLQDDLIGVYGDPQTTGKSVLDDLREGKMTVLVHHALAHADTSDKAWLQGTLGNKNITQADYHQSLKIFESTGSREYVGKLIADYTAQAAKALEDEKWPQSLKEFLNDLLQYLQERAV